MVVFVPPTGCLYQLTHSLLTEVLRGFPPGALLTFHCIFQQWSTLILWDICLGDRPQKIGDKIGESGRKTLIDGREPGLVPGDCKRAGQLDLNGRC
ncbi:hypothetical protein MED297_18663 [Reinekea sp. MED297]|uniref:Uncharacterized protein n=1 Tax=Reinekea blandensis MED297 TaxID=314283 RepID=A4BF04_9GAMM|nr:hypothetical protein MED297_18663 [Reinekea sp. MED297] [Reinekea blandensis MED297]